MAKEKKPDNIHAEHRKRLRKEFLANGFNGKDDYAVLELLLFYAIPQKNVNPLAHALIDHFDSLDKVFNATHRQLMEVEGVGFNTAVLLQMIPAVAARYLAANNKLGERLITSWQFREVLSPLFIGQRNELVYLMCMDSRNKELTTKKLGEGIADSVQITTRKVLEVALDCNATRVVLAHNHVSGVALWSDADLDTTLRLKWVLREAGIELVDHCIFADSDMVSMADSGVLKD